MTSAQLRFLKALEQHSRTKNQRRNFDAMFSDACFEAAKQVPKIKYPQMALELMDGVGESVALEILAKLGMLLEDCSNDNNRNGSTDAGRD